MTITDRALRVLDRADTHCTLDGVAYRHDLSAEQYAELLALLRRHDEATAALLAAVEATLKGVCWSPRAGGLRDRLSAAAEAVRVIP